MIIPMGYAVRCIVASWAVGYYAADIKENPPGSNQGFFVELFQEEGGGQPGWAWCMYWIQHLFRHAHSCYGIESPLMKSGQCYTVWKDALKRPDILRIITADEILSQGTRIPHGSIIIRYNSESDHRGHTGLVWHHKVVEGVGGRDEIIRTIEGNKNDRVDVRETTLGYWIDKGLRGVITGRDSIDYH